MASTFTSCVSCSETSASALPTSSPSPEIFCTTTSTVIPSAACRTSAARSRAAGLCLGVCGLVRRFHLLLYLRELLLDFSLAALCSHGCFHCLHGGRMLEPSTKSAG